MARSHRRLATIAATGALAGLAALAAAGSASAATTPSHATASPAVTTGTVCVVTPEEAPYAVESGLCTTVIVRSHGVIIELLQDLV